MHARKTNSDSEKLKKGKKFSYLQEHKENGRSPLSIENVINFKLNNVKDEEKIPLKITLKKM